MAFETEVKSIDIPQHASEPLLVSTVHSGTRTAEGASADPVRYACQVLVGADGASSGVRAALSASLGGEEWGMDVSESPSGGLAWKVRSATDKCMPRPLATPRCRHLHFICAHDRVHSCL